MQTRQSYSQCYAGCSMNCKSHFNTIKLPGSVPEQGLKIPVIIVSLELVQANTSVSHIHQ